VLEGLHLEVKWYLHETALFDVWHNVSYDNVLYGKRISYPRRIVLDSKK
jgi:hypothetical protein